MTNTFGDLLKKHPLVIHGVTDPNKLACIARARTFTQYCRAVKNAINDVCPFCNVDREHNRVCAENTYWLAWPCNPPEKFTLHHFLYVPKRHVRAMAELTDEELVRLFGLMGAITKRFEFPASGILIRNGDATMLAGTIEHLHVHQMVPDGTGRVESPFYKGQAAEGEGLRRAIVFEKMRYTMCRISNANIGSILAATDLTDEESALLNVHNLK